MTRVLVIAILLGFVLESASAQSNSTTSTRKFDEKPPVWTHVEMPLLSEGTLAQGDWEIPFNQKGAVYSNLANGNSVFAFVKRYHNDCVYSLMSSDFSTQIAEYTFRNCTAFSSSKLNGAQVTHLFPLENGNLLGSEWNSQEHSNCLVKYSGTTGKKIKLVSCLNGTNSWETPVQLIPVVSGNILAINFGSIGEGKLENAGDIVLLNPRGEILRSLAGEKDSWLKMMDTGSSIARINNDMVSLVTGRVLYSYHFGESWNGNMEYWNDEPCKYFGVGLSTENALYSCADGSLIAKFPGRFERILFPGGGTILLESGIGSGHYRIIDDKLQVIADLKETEKVHYSVVKETNLDGTGVIIFEIRSNTTSDVLGFQAISAKTGKVILDAPGYRYSESLTLKDTGNFFIRGRNGSPGPSYWFFSKETLSPLLHFGGDYDRYLIEPLSKARFFLLTPKGIEIRDARTGSLLKQKEASFYNLTMWYVKEFADLGKLVVGGTEGGLGTYESYVVYDLPSLETTASFENNWPIRVKPYGTWLLASELALNVVTGEKISFTEDQRPGIFFRIDDSHVLLRSEHGGDKRTLSIFDYQKGELSSFWIPGGSETYTYDVVKSFKDTAFYIINDRLWKLSRK